MCRYLRLLIILIGCGVMLGSVFRAEGQERAVLSAPVGAAGGAADFRIWALTMKRAHPDSPAVIRAIWRETVPNGNAFVPNGRELNCIYVDSLGVTVADDLIIQLNKVNLSTTSLENRLTIRCRADGKLPAGTLVGTPQ